MKISSKEITYSASNYSVNEKIKLWKDTSTILTILHTNFKKITASHIQKRKLQLIIPNNEEKKRSWKELFPSNVCQVWNNSARKAEEYGYTEYTSAYCPWWRSSYQTESTLRMIISLRMEFCPKELSKQEVCFRHAKLWRLRRNLNLFFHLGND